jgi:hypothetical protein
MDLPGNTVGKVVIKVRGSKLLDAGLPHEGDMRHPDGFQVEFLGLVAVAHNQHRVAAFVILHFPYFPVEYEELVVEVVADGDHVTYADFWQSFFGIHLKILWLR